jgi:hypothetical protein
VIRKESKASRMVSTYSKDVQDVRIMSLSNFPAAEKVGGDEVVWRWSWYSWWSLTRLTLTSAPAEHRPPANAESEGTQKSAMQKL